MEIINRRNKIAARITISLCTLLAAYLLISIFFIKHLYWKSKINGTDVSGKTVQEIKTQMTSELNKYTLNIKERGDKNEQIKAGDISLKYISDKQFKNIKEQQNPLKWASSFFNPKSYNMAEDISYDKGQLTQQIDNLFCLADGNIIQPKEPSIQYENNSYVIVDEVTGNKIDKNILIQRIEDAISKRKTTLDLEATGCYINPKYTSKSQNVVKAKDMLNKYVSSKVTYTFGENKEILDGQTINKWLTVDNDFNVALDEEKVKEYVETLDYIYDSVGRTRNFHTSSGNNVNVSGGDYGWEINTDKETQALNEAIKEGQSITKEPAYSQTAASHGSIDIGNTYVEIDMTKQHIWFYKNGSIVVEGNVVTGNVSLNDATPPGIYSLKDKQRNAILKGQDYASPVCFWMPFNGGIGIHDASWRNEFGGEIYLTNGSHGCVNSPYNVAQAIFENIDVGTPIVCY